MPSLFKKPIDSLKGVGVKRSELYQKLNIKTAGELLRFYPRTYEDWGNTTKISEITPGQSFYIKAKLCSPVTEAVVSGGMLLTKTAIFDGTGIVKITFFNNKYIKNMLNPDIEYVFSGKVVNNAGHYEMASPVFMPYKKSEYIRPVYNQTAGLTSRQIEDAIKQALIMLPKTVNDPLPMWVRDKFDVCPLQYAIENIHLPENFEALEKSKKRLAFEELLLLNLGLKRLKNTRKRETSIWLSQDYSNEFRLLLPFELTNAQRSAIKDCNADMIMTEFPMNRLIQGDVGSGKTAVAASVCFNAVKNGLQAAFMAPTEILAEQHFHTLSKLFLSTGVRLQLITGSASLKRKNEIKQSLLNGDIDLLIGTHALLSDDIIFKNLGLVITDEQHRFGVAQRAKLASKGCNPHTLVMSATPIPRTLGLIIYGDLDISVIDEIPPGRQITETYHINGKKRPRAIEFIKRHISEGKQAYIVCPLVEESETELASAKEYADKLAENELKGFSVGLLHGKMGTKQKEGTMHLFMKGQIQVLVATTVVEVGVDVPNAVVMLIENAERYGLSQLHQLRGRVGRGRESSYCILVSDSENEETLQRLKIICKSTDGFKIAEEDFKLRGPGDFFGTNQHGLPKMKVADLSDIQLLELSRKAADEVLKESDNLSKPEYSGMRAEIRMLFNIAGENSFN